MDFANLNSRLRALEITFASKGKKIYLSRTDGETVIVNGKEITHDVFRKFYPKAMLIIVNDFVAETSAWERDREEKKRQRLLEERKRLEELIEIEKEKLK